MYGKRKYGRLNRNPAPSPEATPTYVCNHCGKIKQFTGKTLWINGHTDEQHVFMLARICEDCTKLLLKWMEH